jgi:2-polyprenyl-3-methyl-5-hydroxy-6-metoxy-1,4-benzoquinol methylase
LIGDTTRLEQQAQVRDIQGLDMNANSPGCDTESFDSQEDSVDALNRRFYNRFNFPWPAATFRVVVDGEFGPAFLSQDLGDWSGRRVGPGSQIWVAGCGTNQAIVTALRFPEAAVLGTDIADRSLEICQKSAESLGIANLTLSKASLNGPIQDRQFDYIICTGVIHHNANPGTALRNLAMSLKQSGVLELMVYNRMHRSIPQSVQHAMRVLKGSSADDTLDVQMQIMRSLMDKFPLENSVHQVFAHFRSAPMEMVADTFLQPVEWSYTVESLQDLLRGAGLEYVLPCLNQFDLMDDRLDWDLKLDDESISRRYYSLSDTERWTVSNLLMAERSPMLWFYVQREDSPHVRVGEREVCDRLAETTFEKYCCEASNYVRSSSGYTRAGKAFKIPAPRVPIDDLSRRVVQEVDGIRTISEILSGMDVEPTFSVLNHIRLRLTTSMFPYLRAAEQDAF